jgi:PAS domain S-box-containing protein
MNTHLVDRTAETRRMQSCLHNLLNMLSQPVPDKRRPAYSIASTLLEGVLGMLRVEFAFIRLSNSYDGNDSPIELLRQSSRRDLTVDVAECQRILTSLPPPYSRKRVSIVPNPIGDGTLRIASFTLGATEAMGELLVAADRTDFPSPREALALQVAADQAGLGLREVQRSHEQALAAREVQQRWAARRAELWALNLRLRREVARHARAQPERWKLAALVEHSSDFIGLADLDGHVLYVNAAGQHMLGIRQDAVPKHVLEYVIEEDRLILGDALGCVLRDGHWEGEVRFRNVGGGAPLHMIQRIFCIRAANGRPSAFATISRDNTERKRAAEEMLALKNDLAVELAAMKRLSELSNRLLRETELEPLLSEVLNATIELQNADMGTVQLYDLKTRRLEVAAQHGFDPELLREYANHSVGGVRARAIALRQRVIISDVEQDLEFAPHRQFAAAAGFRAVQATPLLRANGDVLGVITIHFRLTHQPSERDLRLTDLYAQQAAQLIDRRRTESVLKRSEYYLAAGQKISHTGSWAWNVRDGELLWSDESFRIFGLEPGPPGPKLSDLSDRMHPDDRGPIAELYRAVTSEGRLFEAHFRVIHADGALRHIHCLGEPVLDAAGEPIEYVGITIDITERKLAEEALRRAQDELARVTRITTMGELTASIAHEVNQPLAAVVTNAEACMRWLAATPPNIGEATAAAQRLVRDGNRASEVIARIRALLARGETRRSALQLDETIREVQDLVRGEVRARGVQLRLACEADLPSISGDRIQLQQVILNLAVNAMEAMAAVANRDRRIVIGAERSGPDEVRVRVSDTGPGLADEHRERVFDAFYTTKTLGMGMGLAIGRSIVEAHGGQLWATPNPDGGETFQFTLPVTAPD